uniref:KN motif and ankyrin repeat domains 1b n=1 Tax=Tetraodon nigroviridis TaxID=99883 RepID=H3CPW4_TETNG
KTIPETPKQTDLEVPNQAAPQPRPRQRLASFGGVSSPGSASPFTGLGAYNQDSKRCSDAGTEKHAGLSSSLGSRGSTGCLRLSPESSGRTTPVPNLGPTQLQHVRDQMVVALQKLKELEEQVKIIPVLQVKISVLQEEKRLLACQLKTQSDSEEFNGGLRDAPQSPPSEKGDRVEVPPRKPSKENTFVYTDKAEVRSVATEVSEIHLGIYTEREAEIDAQQLIIGALKDRISHLEAELKESALQAEMSRLKSELKAAGVRTRADKSSHARPSTAGASSEARPTTASQGVGSPTELCHASAAVQIDVKTVGICCRPELQDVCAGPDVPMSRWEVRERVEVMEKNVGNDILMITRAVGIETKSRDAETNTEIPVEDLAPRKEKKYSSVACGDCSVHLAVPEGKSQTVSTSTNTAHALIRDASMNTVLHTRNRHSNTSQAMTRTVSVGNLAQDMKRTPESCRGCASALKQIQAQASKVTRDIGVGFININDSFLVGLKTRNMASGPSHLADPIRMRSVGVGEGRIRDVGLSSSHPADKLQPRWDPELNHYIGKMHKLLGQEDCVQEKVYYFLVQKCHSPPQCSPDSSDCDINLETLAARDSEVKRMIQKLEQQTSSVLQGEYVACTCAFALLVLNLTELRKWLPPAWQVQQSEGFHLQCLNKMWCRAPTRFADKPAKSSLLPSGMKKQKGDQGCSSTRKNMKLLRLNPPYKPYAVEKASSEEEEKTERRRERSKVDLPRRPKCARDHKRSQSNVSQLSSCFHSESANFLSVTCNILFHFRCKLSEKMFSACQALKVHLSDSRALSSRELLDCLQTVQQEWFSVSSQKSAVPDTVDTYLSAFRSVSPSVLQHIANMADGNGNTALHYSVSHSNFGIVQKLLEADVCNMNHQNKAGYTPIMLAALAAVESPDDMKVVEQLFRKGDVNAKASQAGQTALMLAVSHGRVGMVRALLELGADVNLQDDEGSTALMCAGEHGHADMVRLLLAQAHCDATLTDSDGSTALSIALEAGHNDAVLLYAHTNYSR